MTTAVEIVSGRKTRKISITQIMRKRERSRKYKKIYSTIKEYQDAHFREDNVIVLEKSFGSYLIREVRNN